MNKKCFRLIFSKVLGFLIPVAEITTSQGKKSQGVTQPTDMAQRPLWPLMPVVAVLRTLKQSYIEVRVVAKAGGAALVAAVMFAPSIASALPVADPAAGANKPNVVAAANGVPVIEIVDPNAAGLSHNKFQSFDSTNPGTVFNNSKVDGTSSIGGFTMKNPKLSQEAKGILVDVTGTNPSSLSGTLEVFGKKADLFISNQNGVSLNGVTTLNANSLTATTGKPIVTPSGLQFSVNGGRVTVGPSGLDTTGLSYFDIVARTIALQGPVGNNTNSADIKAIAGLNTYTAGSRQVDVNTSAAADTPAVAIDGALAGAMYGRNISLISTETGAGVRHAGLIRAAQDISISAQGDISVGTLQAGNQASLDSAGSIQVGTGASGQGIVAGKAVTLNAAKAMTISNPVQGETLSLTASSLLVQAAKLTATSTATAGPVKSINIKVGDFTLTGNLVAHNLDGSLVAANQPLVISNGRLQVQRSQGNYDENFTLETNAMVISHNGVNLDAGTVNNNGGIIQDLGTSGINLLTQQLTNKGLINTHGDMKLVGEVLNNLCTGTTQQICAGIMAAGNANLQVGTLTNQAGLVSGSNLDLTLKDKGTIGDLGAVTAKGQLNIKQAAGNKATLASTGQIVSGGDLLVILEALSNASANAKVHSDGKATFQIAASLANAGVMEATQNIDIAAGDFSNSADSTVMTNQNLQIVTEKKLELGANSNVHAGVAGKLSAGTVLQNAAIITAGTTLDMHADEQLVNDAGTTLASQVLNISGDQLTNKKGSLISVDDQLNIHVKGDVSNAGQSFMLSGGDISIVAGGNISNLEGSVVSAGRHVAVEGHNVTNSGKALAADATDNDVSTISGADVTIKAHGDVHNDAKANLVATGALGVQADGSVSNVDANMAGSDVKLQAGTDVVNQSGAIAGDRIHIDAQGSLLNTVKSTINAAAEVVMAAVNGVSNDNSLIKGPVVTANGGTIDNAAGANILGDA
ncbi:filamentous hemagglutinin N-terminal domain-containing protein, partial [Pseudomonas sp. ITA]|uniref:two-partner secretion domain-containing protein n=1 Tax=Pseudomonas sp. ITA TaxID=2825841 RepID=UPI002498AA88